MDNLNYYERLEAEHMRRRELRILDEALSERTERVFGESGARRTVGLWMIRVGARLAGEHACIPTEHKAA